MIFFLNSLVPVFVIILLGWLMARWRLIAAFHAKTFANFVLNITLPALIISGLSDVPVKDLLNISYLYAYLAGLLITFSLSWLISLWFYPGNLSDHCLRAFVSNFSNSGFMGIPVLTTLLGQQILAPLLVVNIAMTVLLNLAAFIVLEVARANARLSINSLLTIILKVLAKPMMVATLVALTFAGLGWQLPLVVKSSAQLLGEATSPCALFAIGLALARQRVRLNWEIWFNASYKLILQPLVIFALLAWVFNAQGMKAQTALLAAALPAGTSGVLLAQYYRTYRQQSASTVLLTTLMSMLTLPLFIKLSAYL